MCKDVKSFTKNYSHILFIMIFLLSSLISAFISGKWNEHPSETGSSLFYKIQSCIHFIVLFVFVIINILYITNKRKNRILLFIIFFFLIPPQIQNLILHFQGLKVGVFAINALILGIGNILLFLISAAVESLLSFPDGFIPIFIFTVFYNGLFSLLIHFVEYQDERYKTASFLLVLLQSGNYFAYYFTAYMMLSAT